MGGGARPVLRGSPSEHRYDVDLAPLSPVAEILGLAMVVAALATSTKIPGWVADYGIMVIVAAVLYLAVAIGLVRWGAEHRREPPRDT